MYHSVHMYKVQIFKIRSVIPLLGASVWHHVGPLSTQFSFFFSAQRCLICLHTPSHSSPFTNRTTSHTSSASPISNNCTPCLPHIVIFAVNPTSSRFFTPLWFLPVTLPLPLPSFSFPNA